LDYDFFYCKIWSVAQLWFSIFQFSFSYLNIWRDLYKLNWKFLWRNLSQEGFNPILHGGGVKLTPPGWLLYANPQGMSRMGWFFMTLFLSILKRSWVGHFWSTIFSAYSPKGGPFYTCKNASIFGSFLVSKMVIIQLQMHKYWAKTINFCQNMPFYQVWIIFLAFK